MAHHSRRRAGLLLSLTLTALLGAVGVASAAPAVAVAATVHDGSSVYVGARQGYGGTGVFPIYATTPADPSNPGEPDLWAYCIEHDVHAETRLEGVVGNASGFLGTNYFTDPAVQSKVYWVLAHSYPALSLADFGAAAGAPGISRNDAIEATQYAIWRYTELTWDAAWSFTTPDSEAAYWYLLAGANASTGTVPVTAEVAVSSPSAAPSAGQLVGPFVVTSDASTVEVSVTPTVPVTDAAGAPVDLNAVTNGQELYLDLRGSTAAGSATITVTVPGSSVNGHIVSVPTAVGGTATADSHAQSIVLVAGASATTDAQVPVTWAAAAVPAIGTTLTDAADGDHTLPWNGGAAVDEIAYSNLTPGIAYTVTGELVRASDGSSTGIAGSTTFTPTTPDGTVTVRFDIPDGYAGHRLVAFESLFEAGGTTPIAVHRDLTDAGQTIVVASAPITGTSGSTAGGSTTSGSTAGGSTALLASTGSGFPAGAAAAGVVTILAGLAVAVLSRRRWTRRES
ncbi:hypothetical protein LLS1_05440 [Leifsonia sp. LS1]|uniref:VaFE repeat-containing surface-anchored protein n=1 Tax=Leifsonia sp. LS1 TaxID=2828483 RepID=UPI001CFE3CD8|nr:VaFE repeat-containing surface-anchored protein [Leifsonia sp. LS1]GIT78875.1 hypothetical protein LLS1_05440 [Leifsonia sp. LS1]